ncbi:hypothetical protein BDF21DRAFT_405135 [Thamnidium elegans]|nr:hypothetical protein BDF21DRAFT_405135 [Thamnidium elegans]
MEKWKKICKKKLIPAKQLPQHKQQHARQSIDERFDRYERKRGERGETSSSSPLPIQSSSAKKVIIEQDDWLEGDDVETEQFEEDESAEDSFSFELEFNEDDRNFRELLTLAEEEDNKTTSVLLKNLKIFQENVRNPTVENLTENVPLQNHLKLLSLHRTSTLVSKKLSTLKPKIYETCHNGCTMIYAAISSDTVRLNVLIHAIPDLNFVLLKNLEKHPLLEKPLAPTVAARDTAPIPTPISITVFTHGSSDADCVPSDIEEGKSDSTPEETADSPVSRSNNVTDVEEPAIKIFTDDMILEWTQGKPSTNA